MEGPEFLICIDCETPCYTFEWAEGKILEAMCLACGNDEPDEFMSEEDFEALTSSGH
ncbi:MAG: hypothetical protein AAGN66_04715 [Acidobacteriota bacterium]